MVLVDYRKNTMAIIIHGAVLCLPIKHPSGVRWGLPHQSQPQQTRGRGAFLWVLPIDSQTLCLCCFEETTFQSSPFQITVDKKSHLSLLRKEIVPLHMSEVKFFPFCLILILKTMCHYCFYARKIKCYDV